MPRPLILSACSPALPELLPGACGPGCEEKVCCGSIGDIGGMLANVGG